MEQRILGNTGINVSEIGFGAWTIGSESYGEVSEADATDAITSYVQAGGNFIDTARRYGASERRIGQYLEANRNREKLILCSKTFAGQKMESITEIREDVEESLKQLSTSYIDIYYLHQPPENDEVIDNALIQLEKAKEEGLIKYIGASIKGPNVSQSTLDLCQKYIAGGRVDVLQVVYSILRQKLHGVIIKAHEAGIGIVARTALESGFLTGKYPPGFTFPADDHRARWSREHLNFILETTQDIRQMVPSPYTSISEMATKFSLSNPGVSTLILGARNSDQVNDNMNTSKLPMLSSPTLEILKRRYGNITEKCNTKVL